MRIFFDENGSGGGGGGRLTGNTLPQRAFRLQHGDNSRNLPTLFRRRRQVGEERVAIRVHQVRFIAGVRLLLLRNAGRFLRSRLPATTHL